MVFVLGDRQDEESRLHNTPTGTESLQLAGGELSTS